MRARICIYACVNQLADGQITEDVDSWDATNKIKSLPLLIIVGNLASGRHQLYPTRCELHRDFTRPSEISMRVRFHKKLFAFAMTMVSYICLTDAILFPPLSHGIYMLYLTLYIPLKRCVIIVTLHNRQCQHHMKITKHSMMRSSKKQRLGWLEKTTTSL